MDFFRPAEPRKNTMRQLEAKDEQILWTMLMHAAHETSMQSVKANPDLARYVVGWGKKGDVGYVFESEKIAMGAAWLRLWSADERGYGYVNETIPELAIALIPEFRGQGLGTVLLKELLAIAQLNFPAVSLSIRADNPALRLYQRLGFTPVPGTEVTNRAGGVSFTMLREF